MTKSDDAVEPQKGHGNNSFACSTASFTEDNSPIRDEVVWLVGCDSEDCPAMPLLCGNARKVNARKAWNTRVATIDRVAVVREFVKELESNWAWSSQEWYPIAVKMIEEMEKGNGKRTN